MKILKSIKLSILTSALVACGIGYAGTLTPADADIVSAIHAKYSADKLTSDLTIAVTSHDGYVSLTGKVNTDTEADKLIELADTIPNVKDVETKHLLVKKSKHRMADTTITAKVKGKYIKEKLLGDQDVAAWDVKVETTNGVVYLTGVVGTQEEMENAVKLAKSVKGVKSVKSKLVVKPDNESN
jgi:hyperosmotically inducible protein